MQFQRIVRVHRYIPKQMLNVILFAEFRMPESEVVHIKPTEKGKNPGVSTGPFEI